MTFSTTVSGGPDDEVTDTGTERRFQPPESSREPTRGGERSLRRMTSQTRNAKKAALWRPKRHEQWQGWKLRRQPEASHVRSTKHMQGLA